jgi:hypothetical protein
MPSTNNFYSSARFKQKNMFSKKKKKHFEKASPEIASTDSFMGCAQAKKNYPQANDILSFQNISSLHKSTAFFFFFCFVFWVLSLALRLLVLVPSSNL